MRTYFDDKLTRRKLLIGGGLAGLGTLSALGGYRYTRYSNPPEQCRFVLFSGIGPHNVVRGSKWLEAIWSGTKFEYLDGVTTGANAIPVMRDGLADIVMIGSTPSAIPIAENYGYKIFYSLMLHGQSEALVLHKRLLRPNTSIAESLAKAKLWAPAASTAEYMLSKYLKLQGVENPEIKNGSPRKILEGWKDGYVDGAYIWGDVLLEMKRSGIQAIHSGSPEFTTQGYLTADVCLVRESFWLEHKGFLKSYTEQLDRAVSILRSNPPRAARIIAGKGATQKTLDALALSSNGVIYQKLSEQQQIDSILGDNGVLGRLLSDSAVFLNEQGHLPGVLPNNANQYYDAVLRI